jgi:hypothetical protein
MADAGPDNHSGTRGDRAASTVRRLPLPVTDPPYDDEVGRTPGPPARRTAGAATLDATQGALALSFALPGGYTAVPELRVPLNTVGDPDDDQPAIPIPLSRASVALPDPRRWSATLTQAVMETLYGPRPVQQLARWTDGTIYRAIAHRVASRSGPTPGAHPQVRSVRVCRPAPTVAEASVVVQTGRRVRAVALRLEIRDRRWLCTALDVI